MPSGVGLDPCHVCGGGGARHFAHAGAVPYQIERRSGEVVGETRQREIELCAAREAFRFARVDHAVRAPKGDREKERR